MIRSRSLVASWLLTLLVLGCSGGGGQAQPAGTAGVDGGPLTTSTFDVQWTPQTTIVGKAQLGLLKASDPEVPKYTFDAAAVAAAKLDLSVGRVLVVEGVAFGKISSASTSGSDLEVVLERATLGDAISDGVIEWDFAVPFTADRVQILDPGQATPHVLGEPGGTSASALERGRTLGVATGPVKLTFSNGPFDYTVVVTLNGNSVDLDISAEKSLASKIVSTYSVKTHVETFRSKNRLQIVKGELVDYQKEVNGLKGDLAAKLVVAGSGNDLGYKFPVKLLRIPFTIGPIPAFLDLAAVFVVNASVPLDGTASVEAKVTYDSELGFRYQGTTPVLKANMFGYSIDTSSAQPYAASAAQIGASFGVGFPEIRLGVGLGVEAAGWVRSSLVVGASFTAYQTPIPVCVLADAEFIGAAGYDVSVFGLKSSLLAGSKTLFDYKKSLRRSGQCPP